MKNKLLWILFALTMGAQAASLDSTAQLPPPLAPTPEQPQAAHMVAELLTQHHYKALPWRLLRPITSPRPVGFVYIKPKQTPCILLQGLPVRASSISGAQPIPQLKNYRLDLLAHPAEDV